MHSNQWFMPQEAVGLFRDCRSILPRRPATGSQRSSTGHVQWFYRMRQQKRMAGDHVVTLVVPVLIVITLALALIPVLVTLALAYTSVDNATSFAPLSWIILSISWSISALIWAIGLPGSGAFIYRAFDAWAGGATGGVPRDRSAPVETG